MGDVDKQQASDQSAYLVISGINEEGERMRPSDWVERISSVLGNFGSDHRLQYSSAVQPCIVQGEKCLVVARELEQLNPEAYEFVMNFTRVNRLRMIIDRRHDERSLKVASA